MPEGNAQKKWISGAILAALITVAAIRGIPSFMLALVALPVICAVQAVCGGWQITAGLCVLSAVCCVILMPGAACVIGILWCVCCAVIPLVPLKKKILRPMLWAALCVLFWCIMLGAISADGGDTPANVMARTLCDMVSASPQRNSILINAYGMGLARLEGTANLSSLNYVLMPEDIRLQLLYSLRVTLEQAFPQAICESLVIYSAVMALLCTALPDWRRRRRGEKGELPPMEEWYIPRGWGLALLALALGWLVATLSGGGADSYFGLLCLSVFRTTYTIQGICLLLWVEKRMGIRGMMRNIGALLVSLIAPIVPMIMGLIDQRRDSRHLRPEEVEDT